jgi:hypothetical protein
LSQAIKYVLSVQDKYEKIVFSRNGQLNQSYMFFLYFGQIDPAWYQKQGGTLSGGFNEDHYFGKYEFRNINWDKELLRPRTNKTLYIGDILQETPDLPEKSGQLNIFNLLNSQGAIRVVVR